MSSRSILAILLLTVAAPVLAQSMPEGRLLRFPDVSKDKIVFSYGGDLWLVSREGGTAQRITSHPGQELFAKFSPDGKWIAFTGQYDGNIDAYVMPAEGGEPRRLTWHPDADVAVGWTPDSKRVLFRSPRDAYAPPGDSQTRAPDRG